jgi:hypothetical protein
MPDARRIVVAGAAGAMPFAGVGWQVAQYLEGLRRLGHDVFYLEDTQRWPYDPVADTISDDAGPAIAYVSRLMERSGLRQAWAYRDVASGGTLHGASERELANRLDAAEILINLSGATLLRDEHLDVPVRVYLETDPVRLQIEVAQGRREAVEYLAAHTHHFSYGENLGAPDCRVPVERFTYRPTRPPVILDWWAPDPGDPVLDGRAFTTIANWRQTGYDLEYQGELLTWSKHVEFERFIDVARLVATPIELALSPEEPETFARLRAAGWRVRPARPLSADLEAYRTYIRSSGGEFSVAKEQNVKLRSGWFSDRTATYLAAGRPAIVQDTAFDCSLPIGEGLFAFNSPADVLSAFDAVQADYPRHARAARRIAERHLRAETVLAELIADLDPAPAAVRAPSG